MKKIVILFSILLIFSCGKKNKKDDETKPTENVTIDSPAENQSNSSSLTEAGMDLLDKNKMNNEGSIDPVKLESAKTAANNGDVQAMMALSGFYYQNKDMVEAKKWLKMAADKGEPAAMNNLGILYQQEGNTKEARNWFKKVAESTKDLKMTLALASNYAQEGNLNEARVWFEKAYNLGEKRVDGTIGEIYQRQKNDKEALKWYKKAIARGEKQLNLRVGGIYFDQNNNKEALEYLMKAYNLGAKQAAMPIAIVYQKQNNIENAKKWYKIAAANGDKGAKKNLELLNNSTANGSITNVTPFKAEISGGLASKGGLSNNTPKENRPLNLPGDENTKKDPNKTENTNANVNVKSQKDPNNMFDVE
ncbi:MAG: sel1 repeat family protein [Sebaldella sp.]|nr:sel1 repeat family protein [Sebaldella sp.]